MKVIAENFQSFGRLEFEYGNLGLALISGATGSGKSTFMDVLPWLLFGTTSKDGSADDVLAWGCEDPTKVVGTIPTGVTQIEVTRIRGGGSRNDLYWTEPHSNEPVRGKDMRETQLLLEQRLGFDAETFLTTSYMSQFSDGGRFFTMKAKERREILDKTTDLSLPNTMAERMSAERKEAKKALEGFERTLASDEGGLAKLFSLLDTVKSRIANWDYEQGEKIADLAMSSNNFEKDRETKVHDIVSKLEALDKMIKKSDHFDQRELACTTQLKRIATVKSQAKKLEDTIRAGQVVIASAEAQRRKLGSLKDQCPTCLGPSKNPNLLAECERHDKIVHAKQEELTPVLKELKGLTDAIALEDKLRADHDKIGRERRENDALVARFRELQSKAIALRDSVNYFADRYEAAKNETNPYFGQQEELSEEIQVGQTLVESGKTSVKRFELRVASLSWFYDKSFVLRGLLLQKAISAITKRTNAILEKHFDASLRVKMQLDGGDKLEVEINNSGYACKFHQLSGGERAQLKVAFSIALLESAQNKAGRKFDVVMFDEALNGMDNGLKMKAFGVFQELAQEHATVLLIDHSEELKSSFDVQFHVEMTGASSEISLVESGI